MTDQFTTYDAAYLLGALTPQDRATFEEHLAGCKECQQGVNALAGLPGLLASVPPEMARTAGEPGPEVPATLLPRLMAEVERARFRRRWTSGLVGAAAAAVLAVLIAVGLHVSFSDTDRAAVHPPAVARQMTPVSPDIPIIATAALTDKSWGTMIRVRCTYTGKPSPKFPGPVNYWLVVIDKSGNSQQVAVWAALPGHAAVVNGSTSVHQDEMASVQVLGPTRQPVLILKP